MNSNCTVTVERLRAAVEQLERELLLMNFKRVYQNGENELWTTLMSKYLKNGLDCWTYLNSIWLNLISAKQLFQYITRRDNLNGSYSHFAQFGGSITSQYDNSELNVESMQCPFFSRGFCAICLVFLKGVMVVSLR
jgi:hypothetical protein